MRQNGTANIADASSRYGECKSLASETTMVNDQPRRTRIPAALVCGGKVGVPYKLDRERGSLVPGRGYAGQTVWTVALEDLEDALRALPRNSWLPETEHLARCMGLWIEDGPWL